MKDVLRKSDILNIISYTSLGIVVLLLNICVYMIIDHFIHNSDLPYNLLGFLCVVFLLIFFILQKKKKGYVEMIYDLDPNNLIIGKIAEANMPISYPVTKTKLVDDVMYYKGGNTWYSEKFIERIDKDIFYLYKNLTLPLDTKIKMKYLFNKHLLVEAEIEKGFISSDAIILLERED